MQRIVESLQAQRGPLYSTNLKSAVGVENNAYARALDRDAYGVNERLANQFDPTRMTVDGLMPRWERIFGLTPPPGATEPQRRAAVTAAWQRFVQANNAQGLSDTITGVLGQPAAPGSLLVEIQYLTPAEAVTWWPENPNPSPDAYQPTPWYSTLAYIAIKVQQPAGMTDADFTTAMNLATVTLDGLLPSCVTFAWWTTDTTVGADGFYLDTDQNLWRDAFDV
jgi:hypothetical protein